VKENPDLDLKINEAVQSFIDLIERKYISTPGAKSNKLMDFAMVSQYFALDVITSIAFGAPFGYLAKDEDIYNYIAIINQVMPFVNLCSSTPTLGRFMDQGWLKALIGPGPNDKDGLGKLMGFVFFPLTILPPECVPAAKLTPMTKTD